MVHIRQGANQPLQHQDLRDLLLSTGDAKLIEAATVDNAVNRLWGEVNGVGENMLGKMLMELRTKLRRRVRKPSGARRSRQTPAMVAAE